MASTQLAPGFLLAAPSLRDSNFGHTVVLLGRHDDEGALGWVINGPELASMKELLTASELFPKNSIIPDTAEFLGAARVGGPVAPASGWLIYRRGPTPLPGEMRLGTELAVTGEVAAFNGLLHGVLPTAFRLVLGCAGWGPGQLEAEIAAGSWLPTPVLTDLVFGAAIDSQWSDAYYRCIGANPATFSNKRGQA